MSAPIETSKEELERLYGEENLTTFQIAKRIGCCQATVWKKLNQYGIKLRLPGIRRVKLEKDKLEHLYLEKKLSTWRIEKITGIPRSTIHRKLKEFKITSRDLADSHIIYPRKDFSGDLLEKMYLIGFRIGDLGVRKAHQNSKTICVASGSTIREQIDLIESLFNKYGNVWIKEAKNNKINVQVFLNNSFDFLLNKELPKEIEKNEEAFFAFLAGFTDAEGHIGINKGMAYYALGNCDLGLLIKIKGILRSFNIPSPNIITHKRKGKPTTNGYFYNFDYHTLRVNRKKDLLVLFNKLKEYSKHKKRIEALNRGLENIKLRIKDHD